jgi:hypothetical protein
VLFKLTIPRDLTLVPAVRQVAERVAQCAGYTAADAARMASSVGQAVEAVLARRVPEPPWDGGGLDIRFERQGVYLDVWVRYRADDSGRPAVDAALSSEALRQGMESVEFGREGEVAYCRLRRTLPREKVDHQCDVPPDAV